MTLSLTRRASCANGRQIRKTDLFVTAISHDSRRHCKAPDHPEEAAGDMTPGTDDGFGGGGGGALRINDDDDAITISNQIDSVS